MESDSITSENVQERENSDPLPDGRNVFQSIWIRCNTTNCHEIDKWLLECYNPFVFFWWLYLLYYIIIIVKIFI
jgi:hypothetical protein